MANGGSVDWKTVATATGSIAVTLVLGAIAYFAKSIDERLARIETRQVTTDTSVSAIREARAAERAEYAAKMKDHDARIDAMRALLAPYVGWHEQQNQRDRDQDARLLDLEAMFDRKRDGVWDGELEFDAH